MLINAFSRSVFLCVLLSLDGFLLSSLQLKYFFIFIFWLSVIHFLSVSPPIKCCLWGRALARRWPDSSQTTQWRTRWYNNELRGHTWPIRGQGSSSHEGWLAGFVSLWFPGIRVSGGEYFTQGGRKKNNQIPNAVSLTGLFLFNL